MKKILKKVIGWFFTNIPYLAMSGAITLMIIEFLRVQILPEFSFKDIERYINQGATVSAQELVLFMSVIMLTILTPASLAEKIKSVHIFLNVALLTFSIVCVAVSLLLSLSSGKISSLLLIFLGVGVFNTLSIIRLLIKVASGWFLKTKDNDELSIAKLVLFWGILAAILGWILNK